MSTKPASFDFLSVAKRSPIPQPNDEEESILTSDSSEQRRVNGAASCVFKSAGGLLASEGSTAQPQANRLIAQLHQSSMSSMPHIQTSFARSTLSAPLATAAVMEQKAASPLDHLRAKRQIDSPSSADFFDLPPPPIPDVFEHQLSPIETLRGAMNTMIFAAEPVDMVGEFIGAGIKKACSVPVMQPICKTTGEALGLIGQAIEESIPESLVQGADFVVQSLDEQGIPPEMTRKAAVSTLKVAAVYAPIADVVSFSAANFAKGLKAAEVTAKSAASLAPAIELGEAELRKLATKEAREKAYAGYREGLAKEQEAVQRLGELSQEWVADPNPIANDLAPFTIKGPQNINQFFVKCDVHPFKRTQVGPDQKGIVEGHLLYTETGHNIHGKSGLFLIALHSVASNVVNKVGSSRLIEATRMAWDQRVGAMIEEAFAVAREKGFTTVSLAWDHQKIPLIQAMNKQYPWGLIHNGGSTLSTGLHQPPLTVINVFVPPKHP